MPTSLREYLDFATETAYVAGRLTLGHFRSGVETHRKADDSPVTIADRAAEDLIRSRIEARFPDHAIVGEERGASEHPDATHRWIIDPIDGTKSFIRGVPLYAVLIGLEIEGRVEVGVAHFPALDETVSAATGEGAWWNGRRTQVSSVTRLEEATVAFSDVAMFAEFGKQDAFDRVAGAALFRAGWGDAYGHYLVATGRVEIMMDPIMNAWDCGPFPPILREAGGYFGDWKGTETIEANEALSTSEALLPEVLATIRG